MNNYGSAEIENLLDRAIDDGRSRNYKAAVKKLKTVLSMSDDYPRALLYLGRAYHALGSPDEAILAFRMYISRKPGSGAGYFFLGRTYLVLKRFNRSALCFKEAVEANPDFAPAYAYYGYSQLRRGEIEEAQSSLQKAVELEPENQKIYTLYLNTVFTYSVREFRNENMNTALQGFKFIEEAEGANITTRLYSGLIYKEMELFDEAVECMEDAAKLSPDDELIRDLLAELYIRSARLDEAVDLLGSYKNPAECDDFLNNIENSEEVFAVAYWKRNDYDRALHFALMSLKKRKTADMHLLAGECMKIKGRYDAAWNHYSRAAELERNMPEPKYGQAVICWLQEDYEKMLNIVGSIRRISPDDGFSAYYAPLCRYMMNMPEESWLPEMELLLKDEEDPWLLTAVGTGFLKKNEYKTACRHFRQAIKLNSEHKKAWDGLLIAFEKSGETDDWENALKSYLEIYTGDSEKRKKYANLLMNSGKYNKAAVELKLLAGDRNADIRLLKKLAYCHRMSDNFRDAEIIYRQLLIQDPYNENLLKMLLYCMRKSGDEKKTIPLLREAIKAFKNPSAELLLVYGTTLYRDNQVEEAMNIFQKCIYEGKADWRVYRNMAVIYEKRGIKDWAEMYRKKSDELR